jgi:hypothetical protein
LKGNGTHKMPRRKFLGISSASITAMLLLQGCGGSGDALQSLGKSMGAGRDSTDTSPDEVYSYMRNQALSFSRADFRIPAPPPGAPIWGGIMEFNTSNVAATLLTLIDGTTSLYLGNGKSLIGGEAHENIREANTAFIRTANQAYQHLKPCESFPMPTPGQTIFYARTDSGVLTADGSNADLVKGALPLSPLFKAGHMVIRRVYQVAGYIRPDGRCWTKEVSDAPPD